MGKSCILALLSNIYLGVFLDENLSWEIHVNSISLKLRRANGALSKIRHYVSSNVLNTVMLYFTPICLMHVKYGVKIEDLSLIEFLFCKKVLSELCLLHPVVPIPILFFKNLIF